MRLNTDEAAFHIPALYKKSITLLLPGKRAAALILFISEFAHHVAIVT